jgi:tryptophan synthase alpha chain
MVSYSIVFRYGQERFFADLSTHGFDGVIIPDLPPPEAQSVCKKVRSAGLETILLVSPSTPPQRRKEIVELCTGFVYYLSVAGITGERTSLPSDLAANLSEIKSLTETPVCVGFGVSSAEHVAQLAGHADGAIVGSAYVRKMSQSKDQTPAGLARLLGEYTHDLLAKVR